MDAVSFPKGSIDTTPGPEQAINQNYKGPNINQSDLADNIIGKDLRSSPISSSRQLLNEYFDEYSNYRISAKLKYGHWPVHTISPDLGEKIENVVNALGIDDNVAEYFDRVLPLLEEEEYNTWKSITNGYFGLQTNH
ncbi:hypothetical protein AGDE_03821 [Angomonas deanei]|uniref:Uncharacterized protein n=1 Tax=Angomonas deanei TaxID=59799 RepID=A0A7G2CQY1_9TRYP|nr:hypothetical protein AGDE_03821 [Angomonas deanei]CAD2220913.1 hypothetical protein, conserved [Angomonas deanei]|eukprot:EPY40107.1 hypothetical protein AGDE_03821 [Angomonas deanei]